MLNVHGDEDLVMMVCKRPRVAVVGAGVIGLTVGVALTARSRLRSTPVSSDSSPLVVSRLLIIFWICCEV